MDQHFGPISAQNDGPFFEEQKNLTKLWTNICTKIFEQIWDQRSGPILGHQFGIKFWVTKCGTNILTQIAYYI